MKNNVEHHSELMLSLERDIFRAVANMPVRRPWIEAEKKQIVRTAKKCIGFRDEWVPELKVECVSRTENGRCSVEKLRAISWDGCCNAAHLWLPQQPGKDAIPLVLLCCGHGIRGKQTPCYQAMAYRLTQEGVAVLVPDNIGQGERAPMGHRNSVVPFQCGISVQGLIVMETVGWLHWVFQDERFDTAKICAIGNSGGGVLTLFLSAFMGDTLAAVSSSGYPSTFEFIARKEKNHCHCNILPGIVGELEMWQLYSCFSPRPLFLFQGKHDNLFPVDLFYVTCRKVQQAYDIQGAGPAFRSEVVSGHHSWDKNRREILADFLRDVLERESGGAEIASKYSPPGNCYDSWPPEALDTDSLARQVTGREGANHDELYKIYCPSLEDHEAILPRGVSYRRYAAHVKAFLKSPKKQNAR